MMLDMVENGTWEHVDGIDGPEFLKINLGGPEVIYFRGTLPVFPM